MSSDQYCHIINTRVTQELQQQLSDGDGTFQQDLASCHTFKKTIKKLKDMNTNVVDKSGNLPDINQIENLWVIVKYRLQSEGTITEDKLISPAYLEP